MNCVNSLHIQTVLTEGSTMAQRIHWDIYEAVIMLNALISVYDGSISRKEAIESVSSELRERARANNIEVDEIFRNTNGIRHRMAVMEHIFTDGRCGIIKSSEPKIFREAVDMYRYDKTAYEMTLREAKGVSKCKSTKDSFLEWLSARVSAAQLSELYLMYLDIEKFCLRRKIIKDKLFDLSRIKDIINVVNTVESNKVFRYTYKGARSKMRTAMQLYLRFAKEHPELFDQDGFLENPARNNDPKTEEKSDTDISRAVQNESESEISSEHTAYSDSKKTGSESATQTLPETALESADETFELDFSNIQSFAYTRPTDLSYFDETKMQVSSWAQLYVQVVKCLYDDYPEVFKAFINKGIDGQGRIDFADKNMLDRLTAPKEVCDGLYVETNISATGIFGKIRTLLDKCSVDYENLKVNYVRKTHANVRTDLAPKPHSSDTVNTFPAPTASAVKEIFPDVHHGQSGMKETECRKDVPDEIRLRYKEILEENFSDDGYQLGRAIFRGRVKRFYADKFGYEPAEDDNRIDEIMKIVGIERDGRVYPKQDEAQNGIIKTIVNDITSALESEATAVYTEAVYEKYKQPLADELHVYSPDSIAALLPDSLPWKYDAYHGFFYKKFVREDSRGDILKIMKASHSPQSFDDICAKAWFIPSAKIKNIMVNTTSIVNVAHGMYFYAPNLPVSENELESLSKLINEEMCRHGYLTEKGLMQLISEKLPVILTNTAGFTSYGLRNSLRYLLGSEFSFRGQVITLWDDQLNAADVYSEFVRERETVTTSELSEFSKEIGIPIYWKSVFGEAIRVSFSEFVRKDRIRFDVEAVDNALDEVCPADYTPLRDVNLFFCFPNVGYPWNTHLLESYLTGYSRKFTLLRSVFTENGTNGAVVRLSSGIPDYRSLLVKVLSESDALTSSQAALRYIVDKGYQLRRTYKDIDAVLHEARQLKEQKEKQEKWGSTNVPVHMG